MAGLYLHIPFCRSKCSYCDFYSLKATNATIRGYTDLLLKHLDWAAQQEWDHRIDTVYFGGGTPSLLLPEEVSSILEKVNQRYNLASDAEISLEANPGTISEPTLNNYRSAGINRLSLGLQSCSDNQLVKLGRLHSRQEGLSAYKAARNAGFENISLDLMFALPGQSFTELEDDLRTYLELSPEHLSCYGLTAEPDTPLQASVISGELTLPDEEFYADAFLLIDEQLSLANYEHYEIANYARDGFMSRHNLGYWQRRACLGIGAGAHTFQDKHWGSRWEVPATLSTYRQALLTGQEPMTCIETFDYSSALSETIYLALRTKQGISDVELQQRFGCTLQEAFPDAVASSTRWLTNDSGRWSLTPSGWLLFDQLIIPFLQA